MQQVLASGFTVECMGICWACMFFVYNVMGDTPSTCYYNKTYESLKILQVSEFRWILVKYDRMLLCSSGLMRCVHRIFCSNVTIEGWLFLLYLLTCTLLYLHCLAKPGWLLKARAGRFVNHTLGKEYPALCPNNLFLSVQSWHWNAIRWCSVYLLESLIRKSLMTALKCSGL